ncbi:MAG: FtsK/SpoIIIE domain-containing protein, partial [Sarcina sp.]
MFVEIGAISLIYGAYYRFYKKRMYYDYKNKLNKLYSKNNSFRNALNETPILLDVKEIEEGTRLIMSISGILSLEQLEKQKDFIQTYFRTNCIRLKRLETGLITIDLIKNTDTKEFKIVPTKEYELFVGYSEEGEALKVNLNSFPHMLVGGDSGTGKSRFLMMVLSNLIANSRNVNIYLSQIRKSDLRVFSDCRQVKYIATNLERTRELLNHIDSICIEREKKLDRLIKQGIYNIEDYNNRFKNNKLNY